MIDALKNTYMNLKGRPVRVDFEVNGVQHSRIIEPNAVFNADFYNARNIRIDGSELFGSEIKDIGEIIKQSVILDLETQNTIGGSVINEASLYNADKNTVDIFINRPYHMVNLSRDEEFETAALSSKKRRRVVTIKSSVKPRTSASSFMARMLGEIAYKEDTLSIIKRLSEHSVEDVEDFRKLLVQVEKHSRVIGGRITPIPGLGIDRLQFEESLLRLDQERKIFEHGPLRDIALKYAGETDTFQARYYVRDMEEAKRLGIHRTLFKTEDDRKLLQLFDYLKKERYTAADMLQYEERMTALLQDRYGVDTNINVHYVDPENLEEELARRMQGKNVQAAFNLFESKQLGGLRRGIITQQLLQEDPNLLSRSAEEISALVEERFKREGSAFEKVIQGVSYTGDPLYDTGKEYTLAKGLAMKDNAFENLLIPYLQTTGAKQSRDIQDVIKMTQGTIHQLGLVDLPKPQGLSLEVQARLFGAAKAISEGMDTATVIRQLAEKEAHASAPDVVASSPKVLAAGLEFSLAGQEYKRGTQYGSELYKQAVQGKGPLYGLFAYAELFKHYAENVSPEDVGFKDILFEQRIARNIDKVIEPSGLGVFGNIEEQKFIELPAYHVKDTGEREQINRVVNYGQSRTYKGISGVYDSSRTIVRDIPGVDAEATINRVFERINKHEMLMEFDQETKQYKLPTLSPEAGLKEKEAYSERMGKIRARVKSITESNKAQIDLFSRRSINLEDRIANINKALRISPQLERQQREVVRGTTSNIERALSIHETIKNTKKIMLPVAIGGLAMSGLSTLEAFQQPERSSYLIPSYHDWFSAQAEMYGSNDAFIQAMQAKTGYIGGMQETGMSSILRKMSSDFGSPYTGPEYSNETIYQNELLRERQRKLRYMYSQRHLSYEGDIRSLLGAFISKSFAPPNYRPEDNMRTILSANSVGSRRIENSNLVKVNLKSNYQINVQDADTITVQRDLGNSGMRDFFSGRKKSRSMSIRLAGIDAPETAHENRGAQPYAEAAKRIAADMISRAKNVEVVFDPSDSTYGRRVGVVYADGVNVNLELIKRGAAAYLPYRSNQKRPIYDSREFQAAQETAYKSKRGMWRSDYFRAYKELTNASGQTVTFNTLVNTKKVAENTSLMSMYSVMKTAEAFGMQSTETMQALADTSTMLSKRSSRSSQNIFKPDFNRNEWTEPDLSTMKPENTVLSGMHALQYDLKKLIKTNGQNFDAKHSALKLKSLDLGLSEEVTSARNNSFNKNRNFSAKNYNKKRARLLNMQILQQRENHRMFKYSTGHHRM